MDVEEPVFESKEGKDGKVGRGKNGTEAPIAEPFSATGCSRDGALFVSPCGELKPVCDASDAADKVDEEDVDSATDARRP